ncbi:hypothetical protein ACRRTK_020145 [Alexandromys fortis]
MVSHALKTRQTESRSSPCGLTAILPLCGLCFIPSRRGRTDLSTWCHFCLLELPV